MATLEPVVVVVRSDDLAYLRQLIDGMEPMPPEVLKSIRFNGWTNEQVRLGHFLTSLAGLLRSGDLTIGDDRD